MPTLTRAESARINGAKSRGPATPEGKATSARNAKPTRVVDYTPDVLLINEDSDAYKRVRQAYLDIFHPENQEEFDAVTHYVSARWRLLRCAELETLMLNTSLREIKPEVEADPRGATVAPEAHTLIAYERCLGSTELFRRLPRMEAELRRNLKDAESHLRRLLKERAQKNQEEPDLSAEALAKADTTPIATHPSPANEGNVKYINEPNRTLDLGRNRRCPCGSGLKFKRCCIGKPPSNVPKAA